MYHHTIQQIIDNQKEYKEKIISWFGEDLKKIKSDLKSIKCKDLFIQAEKKKLEKKFNNSNFSKSLSKLFFMHSSRNKELYVWWDETNKEAIILKYDKN